MAIKSRGIGKLITPVEVDEVMAQINSSMLDSMSQEVVAAYHDAGYYGGEFENAHFYFSSNNSRIMLWTPSYTKYMLYGSRGKETGLPNRKMPPVDKIQRWGVKYRIYAAIENPWAVAKKIQKYGTKGNDFLTPISSRIVSDFESKLRKLLIDTINKHKL